MVLLLLDRLPERSMKHNGRWDVMCSVLGLQVAPGGDDGAPDAIAAEGVATP